MGSARREPLEPDLAVRLPAPVRLRTEHGEAGEWTVQTIGAVIGSRPGCDVRLASREVLPLQAVLTRVGSQVVLASLAADKPIRVNSTTTQVAVLQSADTLTVWPVTLRMTIGQMEGPSQQKNEMPTENRGEQQDMIDAREMESPAGSTDYVAERQDAWATAQVPAATTVGRDAPTDEATQESPRVSGEAMSQPGSLLTPTKEGIPASPEELRQWQQQLEQYAEVLVRRDAELSKRARQLDEACRSGWGGPTAPSPEC